MNNMPEMSRDGYLAQVAILQELVGSYREVKGTAAQRKRQALNEALGLPVGEHDAIVLADIVDLVGVDPSALTLLDIATMTERLDVWAEDLADNMATQILTDQANSGNEIGVLKEQYDAQKELVSGLAVVLKAMGVDVSDVTIPGLKVSGTANPGTSNSKNQLFYRIVDGERKNQSKAQNNMSSFAFYHGEAMTGVKGARTGETRDFLVANVKNDGDRFNAGKSWAIEIDGTTYGCDIVDTLPDDAPEATTPAE